MSSAKSRFCRECYDSPEERRRRRAGVLKHWYGLSIEEYDALLELQGNRCALCGEAFTSDPKRSPAVDHDHVSGLIRGVVHQDCNRGLGHFDDNPVKLERAAVYLRTARTPYNALRGKYVANLRKQKAYRRRR